MKRSASSLLTAIAIVAAGLAPATRLYSQEKTALSPKVALQIQQLAALKASNAALLQKQEETLKKLDELKKAADQLRIMSSRG